MGAQRGSGTSQRASENPHKTKDSAMSVGRHCRLIYKYFLFVACLNPYAAYGTCSHEYSYNVWLVACYLELVSHDPFKCYFSVMIYMTNHVDECDKEKSSTF